MTFASVDLPFPASCQFFRLFLWLTLLSLHANCSSQKASHLSLCLFSTMYKLKTEYLLWSLKRHLSSIHRKFLPGFSLCSTISTLWDGCWHGVGTEAPETGCYTTLESRTTSLCTTRGHWWFHWVSDAGVPRGFNHATSL